jgi:hypothetical protein
MYIGKMNPIKATTYKFYTSVTLEGRSDQRDVWEMWHALEV